MAYIVASNGCCHCKECWDIADVPHGTFGVVFTIRERTDDGFERHVLPRGFATWAAAEAAWQAKFPIGSDQAFVEKTLREFEELLSNGDFNGVDELLESSPTGDDTPGSILAILTITKHAPRGRLKEREAFVERARKFLETTLGVERASKLMEHRS